MDLLNPIARLRLQLVLQYTMFGVRLLTFYEH